MAIDIVILLLQAFLILLIIRVVFSWIPRPPGPLVPIADISRTATDWAVEPLRRVLPPVQLGAVALDLSVIVVFLGVQIVMRLLQGL